MDSIYSGIGVDTLAEIKNPTFVKLVQDNVYTFSGAKTSAQAKDFSEYLLDENGKRRTKKQYKEKANEIFGQYNKNWLQTEINHAFASAQNGDKWQQYEDEKDVLPYLKYRTAGDGRVRDEHKALQGVVKHVDDKFWDVYYPPNGWNCRCSVQQVEEGKPTPDSEIKLPPVVSEMRGNSGKKGIIFNNKHPYFEAATANDKMTNFGLPDAPNELIKPNGIK
jgi:SPP1 gp7 family putative phage head morphogenesis protein